MYLKGPNLSTPTAPVRVDPGQVLSPIYRDAGGLNPRQAFIQDHILVLKEPFETLVLPALF